MQFCFLYASSTWVSMFNSSTLAHVLCNVSSLHEFIAGTCRVDLECFCPFNFLRGYEEGRDSYAWNDCKNSFLAAWPESIGNEDTFWRSCTTKEPTTREENNGSSTAPSDGAPDPSPTPSDGDPDPSTAPGGGGGSTTVVAGPSAEKGGINWEKVRSYQVDFLIHACIPLENYLEDQLRS